MWGRRTWVVVGVIGMLSCACLAAWRLGRPGARDFLAEAHEAYRQRNWVRAEEAARTTLRTRPDDLSSLRLLARASARLGKDETAQALYRRLGTEAMEGQDYLLLSQGLFRQGLVGPAQAALGAARLVAPDEPEILNAVVKQQLDTQALTLAAQGAERLVRAPGWEVRGMLALAQARQKLFEPEAAATLLREALRRDPELSGTEADPRAVRRLLASCLLETGQSGEARAELAHLLESGPDRDASWLQSRALLMEGALDEARAALQAAMAGGPADPMRREPAPFVGAAQCASCHPKEFNAQQQSSHARTLLVYPALTKLPWPQGELTDRTSSQVRHAFSPAGEKVAFHTSIERRTYESLIQYAMGSNHHGRTFVGRNAEGQARELRISQYPSEPLWARTLEHPDVPDDPEGYVGRPLGEEPVRKCLDCHSTNFRAVQHPEGRPEAADHAIGCERCHGPGGHHLQAVDTRFPDLAIARPRIAPAERVVALCGECHQAVAGSGPTSKPSAIRFQAPSFVQSRCYTESGTFSCVTCHNPHRNASRNAALYEAICLRCHPSAGAPAGHSSADPDAKTWAPCPTRAESDCLRCHMPRDSQAVPRAIFTDHHIRVRR
jgi:tetratricopeptide (TPR) repeat protein